MTERGHTTDDVGEILSRGETSVYQHRISYYASRVLTQIGAPGSCPAGPPLSISLLKKQQLYY